MRDSQVEELEKLFICQDVFVIQPTGKRKSPIYQSAPVAFEIVRLVSKGKLISLVMSPLPSLMQDQVLYLKSAAQTSEDVGWTWGMQNNVWRTRRNPVNKKMGGCDKQHFLQRKIAPGSDWRSSLHIPASRFTKFCRFLIFLSAFFLF